MASRKYLSYKKRATQTISISPALKEWISRHVNVKHRENPEDARYKSVSAFYNDIMENTLKKLEEGKQPSGFHLLNSRDFGNLIDSSSYTQLIPFMESSLRSSKYLELDLDLNIRFLFRLRKFAYNNGYNPEQTQTMKNFINQLKEFLVPRKMDDFNVKIIEDKTTKRIKKLNFNRFKRI